MADKLPFNGPVEFNSTAKVSGANSKLNYISDPVSAPTDTTTTLTTSQSGAAVLLAPNAALVVLPPASPAGQRFEFVMAANTTGDNNTVTTAGGVYIGSVVDGVGGLQSSNGTSNNVITFTGTAVAGDRFECVSDGTNWYIVGGFCAAADGIGFSG